MTKEELARSCRVPEKMRTDRHEPVTQEQFTRGLVAAITSLGLSMSELEAVKDGKVAEGELRAMITIV